MELRFEAAQKIRKVVGSSPSGDEVGGWLLADRRSLDCIKVATEPGLDASFTRTSGWLGKEAPRALKEEAPHLVCVGDYHLHPRGGSIPSEGDRSTWAGNVGSAASPSRFGLIAVPGESWLSDPKLTGWLTFREGGA